MDKLSGVMMSMHTGVHVGNPVHMYARDLSSASAALSTLVCAKTRADPGSRYASATRWYRQIVQRVRVWARWQGHGQSWRNDPTGARITQSIKMCQLRCVNEGSDTQDSISAGKDTQNVSPSRLSSGHITACTQEKSIPCCPTPPSTFFPARAESMRIPVREAWEGRGCFI